MCTFEWREENASMKLGSPNLRQYSFRFIDAVDGLVRSNLHGQSQPKLILWNDLKKKGWK